ncbi:MULTISPECIES: DUF1396 domain-containing protein [unclassified Streptomyces]|uniref:DUF1396 domain-containing protein n=1 Tax=unclassified Streptomyces TaxID=2593676 RepID=UPI00224FE4A9|nr:DUF1396 domain-containing protein [Streptomyces sp. NBC_00063]MCX5439021.1 DUF1396 domain-containing protein [Streptomyces sp. NBC_00063]
MTVNRAAGTVLAAAAVLGGGATACTSSGGDGKAGSSPRTAAAAAVLKATENGERLTSFGYRMTGEVPGSGRIDGEAAISVKPMAMRMRMTSPDQGSDGTLEMRVTGGALYMGGGRSAAKETDGRSWLKFDISGPAAQEAAATNPLAGQVNQNPAEQVTFLNGSKDLERVGEESVEGEQTAHYKGTVTLDQMRESYKDEDAATRKRRDQNLSVYEVLGVDKLVVDLWVDQDDRTKRFRTRGAADKGRFDMTMTFFAYDKPVTVRAPAAADVVDLAQMMKGATSS